jgi:hypothetical protein
VQQLRASYPTTSCPVPTYLGAASYAFLAPALQEALQESPFAPRTRIVPGEADDWCALHAKDNARSIIFTSDTDLVLYDYRPETLVVFLYDDDGSAGIKAYAPDEIRNKLQLKSLVPFAFVLRSGPQDTSNDLARNARGVNQDSKEFIDFSRRYVAKIAAPTYLKDTNDSPLSLPELDVRVSEFLNQALEGCSATPLVYLPLLVEDPNQASAWNIGYDVRTLAYSLFAITNMTVHEYRRKAQGIVVQEVAPYTVTNIPVPAADIERQVSALIDWATSRAVSPELIWPLFALSLILTELNTPPAIPLVLRVLNNDFDNTWAFVHLMARLQAALYSLRMLKQIVNVWLKTPTAGSKLHTCLTSLNKHMQNFPAISAMFAVPGQAKNVLVEHVKLKNLVEEIYTSTGAKIPVEQVSNKKKKRQAKEADRKKRKSEQRRIPEKEISNTFGVLATE